MKRFLKYIFAILGIIIIIYGMIITLNSNFNFGNIAMLATGMGFILLSVKFTKCIVFIKCVKALFLFCVILAVAVSSFAAVYGANDNVNYKEDAIIVLGAGVRGTKPTLPLVGRLNAALQYLNKNPNAVAVVSGAKGYQEDISEAEAMKRYLVKNGIESERIIKEDRAVNTRQNFEFSKSILDDYFNNSDYKTCFVTNTFHIYRSSRYASMSGINGASHIGCGVRWYIIPVTYLREAVAIVKLWIIGF